ncbi:hypothetical protein [Paenibacillus mucilaginosus]|nr:hypothetical protein [Paenibacillus mucilaginosus]AFH64585.1 hypothetical protein B2K_28465 [Paenibacillus mucilaginosus K02]MCG7217074.1 hypothetical protein [Paenibacillus mucilaginosus]
MAEQSIMAYFHSPAQAESCIGKLKALRASEVRVDQFGEYPGPGVQETMNPITGNIPSLGFLTLGASGLDRNSGVLAATETDASGFGGTMADVMESFSQEDVSRRDTLLTVIIDESVAEQARHIIREAGGTA